MSEDTMEIKYPTGLGAVIAIIVLILAVVFWAMGKMDPITAGLFGALAIARLT